MSHPEANKHHLSIQNRLLGMQIILTVLFIFGQVSLFIAHYKVSSLVDSLVNSSLPNGFLNWVVWGPMLVFIVLQLMAYGLLVAWVWFISISVGELFKLSNAVTYALGILCWLIACLAILSLNGYYFPHSFFTELMIQSGVSSTINFISLVFSLTFLLIVTMLAYGNFFYYQSHRILGWLFLTIAVLLGGMKIYNNCFNPVANHPVNSQPDIILIGMDSLRPDFTSHFGNKTVRTPHVDQFLSSSTTFTQAYTSLARTFPSWISILTAKHPRNSGARNNLVDPEAVLLNDTLPKRLKQAGYETIYATDEKRFSNVTKNYGFDRVIGPSMGVNDFILGGLSDFPLTNLLVNLPIGKFLFPFNYANRAAFVTYEPEKFLQEVQYSVAERSNKPLFLAVHFCISHWPFIWAKDGMNGNGTQAQKYRGSVQAVDAQVGKLMQVLQQNGLLKHSLVVLLSDHGTTLGFPGDRVIEKKKYLGPEKKIKWISVSKYSGTPDNSVDFKRDYGINASYGQGTDVLSLKQNHSLLAFKGYGLDLPVRKVGALSSLVDIAPTILDYLNLAPLSQVDGMSLRKYFSPVMPKKSSVRSMFLETGDSLSEIQKDHIYIEKVVKREIGIYTINADGLLLMNQKAEKSLILNKQRAILMGDWLLARYPARLRKALVKGKMKSKIIDPYYVLVNVKTGQWTIGLDTPFAKKAPVRELMSKLKMFYGDELKPV